jgi:hypothetical protein
MSPLEQVKMAVTERGKKTPFAEEQVTRALTLMAENGGKQKRPSKCSRRREST